MVKFYWTNKLLKTETRRYLYPRCIILHAVTIMLWVFVDACCLKHLKFVSISHSVRVLLLIKATVLRTSARPWIISLSPSLVYSCLPLLFFFSSLSVTNLLLLCVSCFLSTVRKPSARPWTKRARRQRGRRASRRERNQEWRAWGRTDYWSPSESNEQK